jgi:hypothetical protein
MPSKKPNLVPQSEAGTPGPSDPQPQPERATKWALLLGLISREGGATLQELTSATDWLPHTARAAITGLRKRGHDVQCQRVDGVTRYMVGSGGQ